MRWFVLMWVGLFYCSFASVCLSQEEGIAEAVAESSSATQEAESTPVPSARPITVAVSLVDDSTTITGTLTDTNSLAIKTAFGLADLPLGEVAGIRFPRGEDSATTVVMLNGDSITGATDVKFINVETSWGNAKINGQSIATMLLVPGLAWQSVEVLGSRRWQLVEAPRTPQAPAAAGASPAGQPARLGITLPGTNGNPVRPGTPVNPTSPPVRINN